MDPIFIIGTERSGTNLLRLILNSHSNIAVPHPPHIMKFFYGIEPYYGNLAEDKNFKRLIKDVCRIVELHPYPWEIKPDREKVFQNTKERNLINIYFEIYNQYLQYTGKKRWACKSTFMIEHAEDIPDYFPLAKFIYMVRDGRDVAVSAKSSIFNHYHVFYTANLWKAEQEKGIALLNKLIKDQIFLLKYEDLINDTLTITKNVCSFLNESFEEKMIDYYNSSEAKKSASLSISWENTSKPVMQNNTMKFKQYLSKKEIIIFEGIAFRQLSELGYKLINPIEELEKNSQSLLKPKLKYRLSENLLFLKTEIRHLCKDSNSWMRLKKMLYMRYIRFIRRF